MRNTSARIARLHELAILDTTPERAYDDITRVLASSLQVPIALVNVLDEHRDWFKSCVGLPISQSPASTSFCEIVFSTDAQMILVEDTTRDPRFASHPLVVNPPHVRFYVSARLDVGGQTVATLCAYDIVPRKISEKQIEDLRMLAAAAVQAMRERLERRS